MDGEGRHERGTGERDEELAGPWREQAARREEQRRRHGFEGRDEALEHAILTDADDPLAAASGTMRDPGDAPAVLAAEVERQRVEGGPFADTSVLRAELGNLTIPGAPGGFEERPMERRLVVRHDDGQIAFVGAAGSTEADVLVGEGETLRDELVPAGAPSAWVVSSRTPFNEHDDPWSGDPGDEHDPHHVETVRRAVIRDGEGAVLRHHDPRLASVLADGEHLTHEDWPAAQVAADENDVRPTVYAPYGTLTDDALERLEELGLQVEEIDPAEPDTLDGPDLRTDEEWEELELAVADTAADGTVRELRLLEGGAVDLAPPRKVQVWIDLRFQYVSDHPYGAPDTLEEERLRTIGAFVEQFGNMTVGNNFEAIEGMAIQSVVGHILDKPGDPFPAAG